MKKISIFMSKLSIGGMEKAFIDFLKSSDISDNYEVTAYVGYRGNDYYLKEIPSNVRIKFASNSKAPKIHNKIFMLLAMYFWKVSLFFKKSDFSICYSHHHKILADLSRISSKNSICYIHGDLEASRTKEEIEKLKRKLKFDKFSKIFCVSERGKYSFTNLFPSMKSKTYVINNYIDGELIKTKAKETVDYDKNNKTTFINIARHEERSKGIIKLIEAARLLKNEKQNFQLLLIGDGEDTFRYEKIIKENNLQDDVILLGRKTNPYPFLKISDALVVSSNFEGYGLVYDEARVLNIPIITTDVADAKIICDQGYGLLVDKTPESLKCNMKKIISKESDFKKGFDYKMYNQSITKKFNEILGDDFE